MRRANPARDARCVPALTGKFGFMRPMPAEDFSFASAPMTIDGQTLQRVLKGARVRTAVYWDRRLGDQSLLTLELADGTHVAIAAERSDEFVPPPDAHTCGTVTMNFSIERDEMLLPAGRFCARLSDAVIERVLMYPDGATEPHQLTLVLDNGDVLGLEAQATVSYATDEDDDIENDDSVLSAMIGLVGLRARHLI